MSLSTGKLAHDPAFFRIVAGCITAMLEVYRENARVGSIFAAQQRWLMAHLGLGLHWGMPGEDGSGLYAARFIKASIKYDVASRNTAVAFLQEMQAYRFLRQTTDSDGRTRYLEPTEMAQTYLTRWLYAHLYSLDVLDGGKRAELLLADGATMARLEACVAFKILNSVGIRQSGPTFQLFNCANSGGAVMDYLMGLLQHADFSGEKISIGRISLTSISKQFLISNTHLKRLFKQASDTGNVGWSGEPNKSELWLSHGFVGEYMRYQAEKFAVIDAAAEETMARIRPKAEEPKSPGTSFVIRSAC